MNRASINPITEIAEGIETLGPSLGRAEVKTATGATT
jgi:hypothetical protein